MFLTAFDDTGVFSSLMNDDMPNIVRDAVDAFNYFAYHLRFVGERIDYVLRADIEIKDYE
jgi:hypothetical protein